MRISGEAFKVKVDGSEQAPAVILSNALGADLRMWDAQADALVRHFRVVRYDSRGHGRSVADAGPYSIERLGRDALAIMDALGIERAHWIGLSMGAMVGQWALAHARDRFDRAVLANTNAHYSDPGPWNARAAAVRAQGLAPIAEAILERWFRPEFRRERPDEYERLRQTLVAHSPQGYAACCAAIRDMDLREANRLIAAPTLVIVGARDLATPPAFGEEIAGRIPHARMAELDAAHFSNIEQPEAFSRLAIQFLLGS